MLCEMLCDGDNCRETATTEVLVQIQEEVLCPEWGPECLVYHYRTVAKTRYLCLEHVNGTPRGIILKTSPIPHDFCNHKHIVFGGYCNRFTCTDCNKELDCVEPQFVASRDNNMFNIYNVKVILLVKS